MIEEKVLRATLDYIEENLTNKLSLDKIASQSGYSKFHLNRLFKEKTGYTIMKYIHRRRLTKASERLVKTDLAIIEIAWEAGYNSQQSFTCAFNQLYHVSPQRYRTEGRHIEIQPSLRDVTLYRQISSTLTESRLSA